MARRARTYEAFISYSHAADGPLAAQLQRTLNRIARPSYKWWQWWPPRVFRDQTNLAAVGDLTREIQNALLASDGLVLLASPPAAASPWVDKEIAVLLYGVRHRSTRRRVVKARSVARLQQRSPAPDPSAPQARPEQESESDAAEPRREAVRGKTWS